MNNKDLQAFTQQAAKSISTEADLTAFRQMLTKVMVEAALPKPFTLACDGFSLDCAVACEPKMRAKLERVCRPRE